MIITLPFARLYRSSHRFVSDVELAWKYASLPVAPHGAGDTAGKNRPMNVAADHGKHTETRTGMALADGAEAGTPPRGHGTNVEPL
jgi:hypothetical protein